MESSDSPKIYAGMLKTEMLEVADRLGLRGVKKLRKAELLERIQTALRRPRRGATTSANRGASMQVNGMSKAKVPAATKAAAKKSKTSKTSGRQAGPTTATTLAQTSKMSAEQPAPMGAMSDQSRVTAVKYGAPIPFDAEDLRQVDAALPGLPEGYGGDRIVLLPRDPEWLYTYWDLRGETKEEARRRGGVNLALRLYERIDGQLEPISEQWIQEYARSWYLRVPASGQTYVVEIGYRDGEGAWIGLQRSNAVAVASAGPSSVVADQFVTIPVDEPLPWPSTPEAEGLRLPSSGGGAAVEGGSANGQEHAAAYQASTGSGEASSAPGAVPGSLPGGAPSSAESAAPRGGSAGLAARGEGAEGGRDFWLAAEAELVIFGATEPKATLKLGGSKIRLRSDGTFSVRMALTDGQITVPIEAVAADGEQRRGLEMRFSRATRPTETSDD